MTADLADRRQTSIARKAAYASLARAILNDDPRELTHAAFERHPTPIQSQLAA